jgi:hypothetical protein
MGQFELQSHLDTLWRELPSAPLPTAAQRAALVRLLGLENRPTVPVQAKCLQIVDCGSYVEEKYSLDVGEGVRAPIYLLIPKTDPPWYHANMRKQGGKPVPPEGHKTRNVDRFTPC